MKSTNPAGPVKPDAGGSRFEPASAGRRARLAAELERNSDEAARSVGGWDDVWLDVGGEGILGRFAGPAVAQRGGVRAAAARPAPSDHGAGGAADADGPGLGQRFDRYRAAAPALGER